MMIGFGFKNTTETGGDYGEVRECRVQLQWAMAIRLWLIAAILECDPGTATVSDLSFNKTGKQDFM